MKEGTDDTKHGIGILVDRDGSITEGYWKDGKLHGRGRYIGNTGDYCIGEFKGGRLDGEGTCYLNGDKYTGQWDGDTGQGEINYKDGKKYKGYWDWKDGGYKRHGLGTLYSADEQVLNQGKWEWDEYKGKE